jgi:hypothetical protein
MARSAISSIEPLGIHAIELSHPFGQIRVRGFDDQMIMIAHQTIGMTAPIEPLTDVGVDLKKGPTIGIIKKDICPSIAARRHMVQRARVFKA